MSTIKDFIAQVKTRGAARVNRYIVQLPMVSKDHITASALYCESVTLPGMSVNTNPYMITSEAIDFPSNRIFEPVNMTFYVDSNLSLKTWFDAWVRYSIDDRTGAVNYYQYYAKDSDISITVLDVNDTPVYKCTLYEAWPKTVGDVVLSAVDNNVMRLNVTFNYRKWSYEVLNSSNPEGTIRSRSSRPIEANGPNEGDVQGIITGTPDELTTNVSMIAPIGPVSSGSLYNMSMPAYEDDGTPTFVT